MASSNAFVVTKTFLIEGTSSFSCSKNTLSSAMNVSSSGKIRGVTESLSPMVTS